MYLPAQPRPVARNRRHRATTRGIRPLGLYIEDSYEILDGVADCKCKLQEIDDPDGGGGKVKRSTILCKFRDAAGDVIGFVDVGVPCDCKPKKK
jgi:hypothetical protein